MAAYDEHYKGAVQPIELMRAQMSKKETAKLLQYAVWLHQTAKNEKLKID